MPQKWRDRIKKANACPEETQSLVKMLLGQQLREQAWRIKGRERLHFLQCSNNVNCIVRYDRSKKLRPWVDKTRGCQQGTRQTGLKAFGLFTTTPNAFVAVARGHAFSCSSHFLEIIWGYTNTFILKLKYACIMCLVASVASNSLRLYGGHQAPLSLRFFRQEYWSGLPFPTPGIFGTLGLSPHLLRPLHYS